MTDMPPPVEQEQEHDLVTKSTWTSGKKRTMQFYALREGGTWVFYDKKTREPNDAKRAVWGAELSVVDMMALEPQPIKRGWWRFKASRELVDLGRNKKTAGEQFEILMREASAFEGVKRSASQNHIEKVRSVYSQEARRQTWEQFGRESAGIRQVDMFERLAEKIEWSLELCREVVPIVNMEKNEHIDKLLEIAEKNLRHQQKKFQIVSGGSWGFTPAKMAMAVLKQNTFASAIKLIISQREKIKSVHDARKVLEVQMVDPNDLHTSVETNTTTEVDALDD